MLAGRGVGTLVVVPDGVLRTVPFAAMHDGERFLVERYALATAPGLRLVEPRPLTPEARRTLAAGLSLGHDGHPALPNVAFELEGIRRLQRGTTLLDSAFQRSRFERELRDGNYNIVHIASHSQVGRDPSQIFVLAYDGQLTLDELEASIKQTRFRKLGIELLVLSACQTAVGDDDRAALGLAGLALKAGARSPVPGDALVRQRRSLHGADNRVLPTAAEQNPGARAAEHAAQPDERSGAPPPVLLGPISAHRQLALAKEPAVMNTRRAFSMSAIGVAAGGLLVQTGLAQPAGQLQGTDGLQNRSTPRGGSAQSSQRSRGTGARARRPVARRRAHHDGSALADYLLSGRVTHPVRLAISTPGRIAAPGVFRTSAHSAGRPRIARLRDHGVRLTPNLIHVWSVELERDPNNPSLNLVASAPIKCVPADPTLERKLRETLPERRCAVLVQHDYWYAAVDLANATRDRDGGATLIAVRPAKAELFAQQKLRLVADSRPGSSSGGRGGCDRFAQSRLVVIGPLEECVDTAESGGVAILIER